MNRESLLFSQLALHERSDVHIVSYVLTGVMIDWEEYLEFPCVAAVEKLLYLLTSCYSMHERTHYAV